jgi:hypothetical protein
MSSILKTLACDNAYLYPLFKKIVTCDNAYVLCLFKKLGHCSSGISNVTSKRNGVTRYRFSNVIRAITVKGDNVSYERTAIL